MKRISGTSPCTGTDRRSSTTSTPSLARRTAMSNRRRPTPGPIRRSSSAADAGDHLRQTAEPNQPNSSVERGSSSTTVMHQTAKYPAAVENRFLVGRGVRRLTGLLRCRKTASVLPWTSCRRRRDDPRSSAGHQERRRPDRLGVERRRHQRARSTKGSAISASSGLAGETKPICLQQRLWGNGLAESECPLTLAQCSGQRLREASMKVVDQAVHFIEVPT